MAKLLPDEYQEFDLGDEVSFLYDGTRLFGTIARVYNTRDLYHVEVDGRRYEVSTQGGNPDDLRLVGRKSTKKDED